jgi:hypothetical protein
MQILRLVQSYPGDVAYNFDLDPGPKEAEKIAAAIDFCKAHTIPSRDIIPGIKRDDPPNFPETSAAFVRAVGQLNAKLRELADLGVNVYVGSLLRASLRRRRPLPYHLR